MAAEPEPEPEPAPPSRPELAALRRLLVAQLGPAAITRTSTSLSLADDATLRRFLAAKNHSPELACASIGARF